MRALGERENRRLLAFCGDWCCAKFVNSVGSSNLSVGTNFNRNHCLTGDVIQIMSPKREAIRSRRACV